MMMMMMMMMMLGMEILNRSIHTVIHRLPQIAQEEASDAG